MPTDYKSIFNPINMSYEIVYRDVDEKEKTLTRCDAKDMDISFVNELDEKFKKATDTELSRIYRTYGIPDSDVIRMMSEDYIDHKSVQEQLNIFNRRYKMKYNIKKVIFHAPATIVYWQDGSKTVVKCSEKELFDPEKGLAMAICKKVLGTNDSKSNYNDIFKRWIPEEDKND